MKRKVDELQNVIDFAMNMLLSEFEYKNALVSIKATVTNTKRGYACYDDLTITVPLWAYNRTKDKSYFIYYISHELSHLYANKLYKSHGHDVNFYSVFKSICPKRYWKYEFNYIKSSKKYLK